MLVEFAIGAGPPVTAGPTRLTLHDVPATRAGLKGAFEFLMVAARWLDHDEFFVLKTADALNNASETLIWDVSNKLFQRPLLILDGGVSLASLSAAQIRNRMGL